jgi:hypothetical protein
MPHQFSNNTKLKIEIEKESRKKETEQPWAGPGQQPRKPPPPHNFPLSLSLTGGPRLSSPTSSSYFCVSTRPRPPLAPLPRAAMTPANPSPIKPTHPSSTSLFSPTQYAARPLKSIAGAPQNCHRKSPKSGAVERRHALPRVPLFLLVSGAFPNMLAWCLFAENRARRRHPKSPTRCIISSRLPDVYTRFCSCRQCWASKCRGL